MAATTGDLLSHQPPTGGILRDLIQKNMSSFRLKNEVNTPQWGSASLGRAAHDCERAALQLSASPRPGGPPNRSREGRGVMIRIAAAIIVVYLTIPIAGVAAQEIWTCTYPGFSLIVLQNLVPLLPFVFHQEFTLLAVPHDHWTATLPPIEGSALPPRSRRWTKSQ
jgi:hypothetical protein